MTKAHERWNLRALDSLRGFLATYIVLGHARWLLWSGNAAFMATHPSLIEKALAQASVLLRFNHEIVMVFFVLSGFFIHLRVAQQIARCGPIQFAPLDYYRRRIHRLLSPYVLALIVTVAFDLAGKAWFPTLYDAKTGDPLLDFNFARKGYTWTSVVPALGMQPSALGRDFGTNGPLWSLAFEVVYYAIYPLWIILRRKSAWLAYGLVGFACLALSLLSHPDYWQWVFRNYPIWLAGALLAEIILLRPEWMTYKWHCAPLALAGMAGVIYFSTGIPYVLSSMLGGVFIVAVFLDMPPSASNFFIMRFLEFLGFRSYTIYISHFPFIAFLSAMVIQLHGERPSTGWLALAGSIGALVLAEVYFQIAEKRVLPARLNA